MDNVLIIETEHFRFKIITEDDYELYYKLFLDEPEIQWIFEEDMKEDIKNNMLEMLMSIYWSPLIEGNQRETFTIFSKFTLEFIGEISIYSNDYSRAEMGISLLKKYRGQGNGKYVIKEWSEWIAKNRNIRQLDIHIDVENIISKKCVKKLGANYICNDGYDYFQLDIPIVDINNF